MAQTGAVTQLQSRLAALLTEARPGFSDTLAVARELQSARPPPPLPQQVAVSRVLLRSLPASLPPTAAAQLTTLASAWLAVAPGDSDAAPAVQLQAEAAHLLLAMFSTARVKLPAAGARQLLQQVCRLCQHPPRPLASVAAAELACGCADLLAQLPQWYPQPPKLELAAAATAVAAVLDQQTAGGSGAPLQETSATTRLLCKLLRALQVLLAEAKKEHGANAASLAASLQRLFTYGWQPRGSGSGSSTPHRATSITGAAPFAPSTGVPPPSPARVPLPAAPQAAGTVGGRPAPASPGKYRPPHARGSTQEEPSQASARALGSDSASYLHLDSSDSESSDAEGSGTGDRNYRASRVRSGALACLQLLAKADPKSLHGSWTALLPASDAVASRRGQPGSAGASAASVAHLLLHDPQARVRHTSAATIATLLEGPAQRAYLAVAEARDLDRHPVRGFITLSASLGQMLVALHRALLHSIQQEHDPMVLAAALRALGTLLLGAPYHRLPPQLLPLCVAALRSCLAKATPPGGPATLAAEQAPVASACLSCLAAAFSSKAAEAVLSDQLLPSAGEGEAAAVGTAGGEQREQLLQLLFAYAACQLPALQLEAVLALRGVAQQHAVLLQGCWERLLALGRAGAALPAPAVPQSPRAQAGAADGTLPEKVAQQSVRLPGDYLQGAEEAAAEAGTPAASAAAAAAAEQWQQVADQVLQMAIQHPSPLLRAAAQAGVAALSPPAYASLPPQLQQSLLGWCCAAVITDEASPVRAAAVKAVGAVAAAPALCTVPEGPTHVLAALTAGSRDSVLAVCIPAAASLASFCRMLSQAAAAQPVAALQLLPGCLQLAVAAAGGSDKLRPSGLQALGSLFELRGRLPAQQQQQGVAEEAEQHFGAAAQALLDCLTSSNARVQWAACEAAGELLACPAAPAQRRASAVLQQLLALLRQCPNFRSRALAAAALRLAGAPAAVAFGDSPAQLLDAVAAVLFDGKASGFITAAAAGATAAPARPDNQQPPPAELGSKAQLEATLVAAVLHLLTLLPEATRAAEVTALQGDSGQLAQLQVLVRQARRDLLPPPAGQREAAPAAEAVGSYGDAYFDLSQSTPALVAAAARGLSLLE